MKSTFRPENYLGPVKDNTMLMILIVGVVFTIYFTALYLYVDYTYSDISSQPTDAATQTTYIK